MYPVILALHNIVRWTVVVAAVLALVRAYRGWLMKGDWDSADRRAGLFFTAAMDVQLLLGLLLYVFFSPITRTALSDLGAAMSDPGARFFVIEHLFYMVLAVVFAHLGNTFSKKAAQPADKHRRAAIWYTLAVLAIILGMPWMRPLIPGF